MLPRTLLGITDYCCVYRFRGLVPDLERMIPWIDHGHARLEDHDNSPETVAVFRDHVANALLRNGELDRALAIIQPAFRQPLLARVTPQTKGRVLATAGEAFRLAGDRREAGRRLKQAAKLQLRCAQFGFLADFTYPSLAKWERKRDRASTGLPRPVRFKAAIRTGWDTPTRCC